MTQIYHFTIYLFIPTSITMSLLTSTISNISSPTLLLFLSFFLPFHLFCSHIFISFLIARKPFPSYITTSKMHLMYTIGTDGKRIYTLKKLTEEGEITKSAHPARFSPDDKFSRQRVTLKKRYNMLPTQQQQQN